MFEMEKTAYTRLKEHGLCNRKIVPDYYGYLEKLDLNRWEGRHLDNFLEDKIPPSAVFMEYIPHLKELDLETYNKARIESFISGMELIHEARIEHNDIRPRNMMIAFEPDGTERVVWMDFDRARIYDLVAPTEQEVNYLVREMRELEELGPLLVRTADI